MRLARMLRRAKERDSLRYKISIVLAVLAGAIAVVAIAQEKAQPPVPTPSAMGATPAAIGNPTPSSMWTPTPSQLETITPSATPPMAGTPPVSGKPAQRRRTPGAQTTPTAPYSTTPAPSPVMTAPSMTPVPPGR